MRKKLVKWVSLALVLCMGLSFTATSVVCADDDGPITVLLDGEQLIFDVNPVMESDRVLVPMRFIFEALGATVTWEEATETATAVKEDTTIEITIDNLMMKKNDAEIELDVPARLIDGRTMVPVRAVSEGMGADVQWDGAAQQVLIFTPEAPASASPSASAEPEDAQSEDELRYNELSEADMQTLQASYGDLRYDFEQITFPKAVLEANEDIKTAIQAKSDQAAAYAETVWNQVIMGKIIELQINSETTYSMNTDGENLTADYLALVKEAGLAAEDYFDANLETLTDGSVMLLLTFDQTDTLLACKYIGVVVTPDGTVRYFTAETDLLDQENLYFCEVTTEAHGIIQAIKFEKSDFIDAVETALA